MRSLLLVCPTALDPALGVGQVALALATALRKSGVPVRLEEGWKGVRTLAALRARVAELHRRCGPDESLECPAPWVAALPEGGAPVIHRSTQPDLSYLAAEAHGGGVRTKLALATSALPVLAGWRRVQGFLCLGTAERTWMAARAPWLAPRLHTYLHAPEEALRPALAAVAAHRRPPLHGRTRWLWLGRWARHKGTGGLIAFLADRLARFPDETVTLAGTGSRPPLPGLPLERVRVVPHYARVELPALLASHDAGLFTSTSEGWGLSLQEMLETGMPVYATAAGGVEDLAPWFPQALRPFPPVEQALAPAGPARRGYMERFSWDAIGADYAAWLRTLG